MLHRFSFFFWLPHSCAGFFDSSVCVSYDDWNQYFGLCFHLFFMEAPCERKANALREQCRLMTRRWNSKNVKCFIKQMRHEANVKSVFGLFCACVSFLISRIGPHADDIEINSESAKRDCFTIFGFSTFLPVSFSGWRGFLQKKCTQRPFSISGFWHRLARDQRNVHF